MPITFLKDGENDVSVEIVKFGYYLWSFQTLKANLVVVLSNTSKPENVLKAVKIIFPYKIENIKDRSDWMLDRKHPLNRFKTGNYQLASVQDRILDSYDGIENVRVLKPHSESDLHSGEGEVTWSSAKLTFERGLFGGQMGGFMIAFDIVTPKDAATERHGVTYARNSLSVNFSIRLFDRYLLPEDLGYSKTREIRAKVLYKDRPRLGGFDINLFVPVDFIDINTTPRAELLGLFSHDNESKPSEKFMRLVWRARLYETFEPQDTIGCGDRMILSGVFLSPNTFISQLHAVSETMQSRLVVLSQVSERLETGLRKVDRVGIMSFIISVMAVVLSVIGLFGIIAEWDKIVETLRGIFVFRH